MAGSRPRGLPPNPQVQLTNADGRGSVKPQRSREKGPCPAGVHLQDVVELRTGHFSLGRTGAAVGGVLVAAGAALAILVENAQPIY